MWLVYRSTYLVTYLQRRLALPRQHAAWQLAALERVDLGKVRLKVGVKVRLKLRVELRVMG